MRGEVPVVPSTLRPAVTVVIPCRNAVTTLPAQLAALARQDVTVPFEVVLADNGSTDGLSAAAASWGGSGLDLRVVDAGDVPGVAHARNVGLRAARGALVAVCDADDEVSPGWLRHLVAAAETAPLVGGRVETGSLNDAVRRAWRVGPPADRLPVKLGFLPYAVGCNVAVDRQAALDVGGWDESFVSGGDDVDFSWRLQLAGHALVAAPGAVVHYRYRTDLRGTMRQLRLYARCEAQLLRRFADAGARPQQPSPSVRDLRWLGRNLPSLVAGQARRGRWLGRLATVTGRVEGSLRYRTWVG